MQTVASLVLQYINNSPIPLYLVNNCMLYVVCLFVCAPNTSKTMGFELHTIVKSEINAYTYGVTT